MTAQPAFELPERLEAHAPPEARGLARDDVRKQMINLGATAQTSTPEEMRQHIVNEIAKWSAVREKAGIAQQ